jgi:hypothetical protein
MESFSKMPIPNFVSLPWLKLYELETRRELNIMMQVAPENVLCFFSYAMGDDIEVALGPADCRQAAVLFESVLEREAGKRQSEKVARIMAHRFRNLDGGQEAAFLLEINEESVDVTVERSDEGAMQFRISVEDTKRLAQSLRAACKVQDDLIATRRLDARD